MSSNNIDKIKQDKFAEYCGIKLIEAADGHAVVEMELKDKHLNGIGAVHGAAIFAIADYAFAAASNSGEAVAVGINASISYYKSPKGKKLKAVAKEISVYKKLGGYEVMVLDEDDTLVAKFMGTVYRKIKK